MRQDSGESAHCLELTYKHRALTPSNMYALTTICVYLGLSRLCTSSLMLLMTVCQYRALDPYELRLIYSSASPRQVRDAVALQTKAVSLTRVEGAGHLVSDAGVVRSRLSIGLHLGYCYWSKTSSSCFCLHSQPRLHDFASDHLCLRRSRYCILAGTAYATRKSGSCSLCYPESDRGRQTPE